MSLWPMQRVPAGYWKNAEKHEQCWIDEFRDAGIPCTPIPCQEIRISKVRFDPEDYGMDTAPKVFTHHRSCALRSGGTECTC